MTIRKYILIIIAALSALPAYAGLGFDFSKYPNFLSICNNPSQKYKSDIIYLKDFFNSQDCEIVTIRLSKLKHFTDFMRPYSGDYKPSRYSWTNELEFEYIHNWRLRTNDRYSLKKKGIDYEEIYQNIELYSEFKNLKTLQIGFQFPFKKSYCEILKDLPHLETLVIDSIHVKELYKCDESVTIPELLILEGFSGMNIPDRIAEKIIGVEYFVGMLRSETVKLRNLSYLGVNKFNGDLSDLAGNINLTHLSINGAEIKNLENVKEFYNLSWLTITCIENESKFRHFGAEPVVCETPALKDLSFLSEMELLQTIKVPFNKLSDISVIENMTFIRNLDVSNNLITKEPNFDKIRRLNGVDYSNNPIPGLEKE